MVTVNEICQKCEILKGMIDGLPDQSFKLPNIAEDLRDRLKKGLTT